MQANSWLEKPATPILSLSSNTMGKIDAWNPESLASLWTVFSKCAESLENGRRLENLSWRLWNREVLYCCDDSIFLVEDMTDNDMTRPNSGVNSSIHSPSRLKTTARTQHNTLHPHNPPPDALIKSLSALSVSSKGSGKETAAKDEVPQLSSSVSSLQESDFVSDSDYAADEEGGSPRSHLRSLRKTLDTHVDTPHRPALSSMHSRSNRSNLASSASTPTLSTTATATPSVSRISSPPTLRTLVNSNDTNSRPTIRRGNKSISDYRSLYRKRPSMRKKRLSPEKLQELMQLFRPVGQEVEYWQSLREERRKAEKERKREADESSEHTEQSQSGQSSSDVNMLPQEVEDVSSAMKEGSTESKEQESLKDAKPAITLPAPEHRTFFARTRRSTSRHRDSFNREKPNLLPQPRGLPQAKVSSLFRRNTSTSSGSGSSAIPQSAVADTSDSFEDDDESEFTDETDNDDEDADEDGGVVGDGVVAGSRPALPRSDTSTSIVRGFSPSKTSVSFLGRPDMMINAAVPRSMESNHSNMSASHYQQVPRQKQKMFFIESSPSESDGFGDSVTKSDCSYSPQIKLDGKSAADKSSVPSGESKSKSKHVSVQSPPKLDSTKYDDYYNDDDDDSDWDSVESEGSSANEEPTFSREENLSGHNLVRPSLLSSMFLNNPDKLQEQIRQSKDKSRIYTKGMIPDESNSVSSKLGSMFSGQAKRVSTFTNLTEANFIVENGGLNSDGEDIARDNASVALSLKSEAKSAKSIKGLSELSTDKKLRSTHSSTSDLKKLTMGPTAATVLSATPVAVATHEPVYGSILPSDAVRHSMLASEMSQSVQKSLLNQNMVERHRLEALKRRHTSIDLKKLGEAPVEDWRKEAEEPADFDYHARGW